MLGPANLTQHAAVFIQPLPAVRATIDALSAPRHPPTPTVVSVDLAGMDATLAAVAAAGSVVREDLEVVEARRRAAADEEAARVAAAERDRQAAEQQRAAAAAASDAALADAQGQLRAERGIRADLDRRVAALQVSGTCGSV